MQFHPRALLFTALFVTLLWIAVTWTWRLGVVAIAFEVLFGWGLGRFIPEEWPRQRHSGS